MKAFLAGASSNRSGVIVFHILFSDSESRNNVKMGLQHAADALRSPSFISTTHADQFTDVHTGVDQCNNMYIVSRY